MDIRAARHLRRLVSSAPPVALPTLALVLAVVLATATPVAAQAGRYPTARHGGNYMFNFYFPPAPSSTPWGPTWSPSGDALAVGMSGSIWRVDLASAIATELTADTAYHALPDWSPDGRWIIYVADNDGTTVQLEILNVETGESRRLTDDEFIYSDPTFSPDGSRVAYVSTRPNGYFNVYVRSIRDGRWSGEEIAVSRDNGFGRNRLYFGRWDMHITPAWLPSGDELLLVSNRDVPLGSGNVLRVPAVDGGIADARSVLTEQTLYRTRPDVASDGRRFVYSSTRGAADQFNNLYVQPTVGGEPYKLTLFDHDAFHPRWSPDDEQIAFVTNRDGLPQLALLQTHGGALRTVTIRDRRWKRPTGILTVRTRDRATHALTGSRVHLFAADGKAYAPANAYARVGAQADHLFHHPGEFTVELPAGQAELDIVKGFEYWPQTLAVDVVPDAVTEITVELERMTDMAAQGWYSGSTHVHMNYGGNLHNTLDNLIMMSEAEDQDLVLDQVANKDNRILDHQFFVPGGGKHPASTPDHLVVVGQEYRPPFYGHVFMFGMRTHLISPFTMGYEGTAIESLYPSNTDMLRLARAQGATVGYVHAFTGESDPLEGTLGGGKGFMVDAALATTDAVEWSDAARAGFYPLYAVWNNGLRVTATGGEDSISNLQRSKLIASFRTYVHTGGAGMDMEAWFTALREGRAFVSSGPLVQLTINGQQPGEAVALPIDGGELLLRGRVQSITPLETVFVVCNGDTVFEAELSDDRRAAAFTHSLPVAESGWCHLRAEGARSERFPLDVAYAQAFTNPTWVTAGGRPPRNAAAADYGIQWVDTLEEMANDWPGWRSAGEKAHVFGQFEEAREVYRGFIRDTQTP